MGPADLNTPLFGPVFRMRPKWQVDAKLKGTVEAENPSQAYGALALSVSSGLSLSESAAAELLGVPLHPRSARAHSARRRALWGTRPTLYRPRRESHRPSSFAKNSAHLGGRARRSALHVGLKALSSSRTSRHDPLSWTWARSKFALSLYSLPRRAPSRIPPLFPPAPARSLRR